MIKEVCFILFHCLHNKPAMLAITLAKQKKKPVLYFIDLFGDLSSAVLLFTFIFKYFEQIKIDWFKIEKTLN